MIFILIGAFGVGTGITHVMCFALASQLVGSRIAGTATSLINTIGMSGSVLIPFLTGYLLDATSSYDVIFLFLAVIASSGTALGVFQPDSAGRS